MQTKNLKKPIAHIASQYHYGRINTPIYDEKIFHCLKINQHIYS